MVRMLAILVLTLVGSMAMVEAQIQHQAHANHKIEVTGTVSQAGGTASTPAQQNFNVKSFNKMISTTC